MDASLEKLKNRIEKLTAQQHQCDLSQPLQKDETQKMLWCERGKKH